MKRIAIDNLALWDVIPNSLLFAVLGLASLPGLTAGQWGGPELAAVATQGTDRIEPVSAPPVVNAISDDGQKVLLTSLSDLLVAEDDNQAADVFVFDRTLNAVTAVSVKAGGGATANRSSLGGDFAADAGKALFLSRADDLVHEDTNGTWDVFLRDLTTGENQRASVFPESDPGVLPFSMPQVSRDGSRVLFESAVASLGDTIGTPGGNTFVRDLEAGTNALVSTGWSLELSVDPQAHWARMTPDGSFVVMVLTSGGRLVQEGLLWLSGTGTTTTFAPPYLMSGSRFRIPLSPIDLSSDGTLAVYQAVIALGQLSSMHTNAVFLHDVAAGTSEILIQTTNAFESGIDLPAIAPAISAGGEAAVLALPLHAPVARSAPPPAGPSQLLHFDVASRTTTLITAAHDTGEMIDTDALHPRISADGRFVAYVSRATNLVEGAFESRWRVYWWDSQSKENHVAMELADDPAYSVEASLPVFSRNGQWLAVAAPASGEAGAAVALRSPEAQNPKSEGADTKGGSSGTPEEAPAVVVVNLLEGTTEVVSLPLARTQSSTGRGWIAIHPGGVSADGRYAAFASPAGDPAGWVQAWRIDTRTGVRELLSATPDGQPAEANSAVPALSADGARAAFGTYATNLTSPALETEGAVVLRDAGGGGPVFIGESAWLPQPVLLSPDGRYVVEGFPPLTMTVHDTVAGLSVSIPDLAPGYRSFSADGSRLAVAKEGRIQVLEPAEYVATEGQSGVVSDLEVVGLPAAFALSRDGRRLAYSGPVADPNPDLTVVDVESGSEVFARVATGQQVLDVVLSDDGRRLGWWESAGPAKEAFADIWWADVETGAVSLGAVAMDGESPPNAGFRYLDLSGDGRYLTFACLGDDLVAGDDNRAKDVFLRDLETGETLLLSRTGAGNVGNRWSTRPFFSADGRSLFFLSHASDLAADDLNQGVDLFKVEIVEGGPLVVIQRNLTTGGARLLWNGEAGKVYRVEETEDLGSPDWQPIPGGPGPDFSCEMVTGQAHRFYRVVEVE